MIGWVGEIGTKNKIKISNKGFQRLETKYQKIIYG